MEENDDSINQFVNELKPLLEQISMIHQQAYYVYKPQVDHLIRAKIIDANTIERLLDELLDHACNAQVLTLYKDLCRYYWKLNPFATATYINYYREMWDNDDDKI